MRRAAEIRVSMLLLLLALIVMTDITLFRCFLFTVMGLVAVMGAHDRG